MSTPELFCQPCSNSEQSLEEAAGTDGCDDIVMEEHGGADCWGASTSSGGEQEGSHWGSGSGFSSGGSSGSRRGGTGKQLHRSAPSDRLCVAGGKILQASDYEHCPVPQSFVRCGAHHRAVLPDVIHEEDVYRLYEMWRKYQDDLTCRWHEVKPYMSSEDFEDMLEIAQRVVDAMVAEYQQPMVLDQATLSNTNHIGHPPHADNVQFDSVWWRGERIRPEDEVVAAQEGAYVLWRAEKTSYRSYSCTVSLTETTDYEGGVLQFFKRWGDRVPVQSYKPAARSGVAFCGCQRNIHAVTPVSSGFRLQLLIWTRPPHVRVPESQRHVCYFRPGTGQGVWLTSADIMARVPEGELWSPVESHEDCSCERCRAERSKCSWREARKVSLPEPEPGKSESSEASQEAPPPVLLHCPLALPAVKCRSHGRHFLHDVLSKADRQHLKRLWEVHHDDLAWPRYEKKPQFSDWELITFREIANQVVRAMSAAYGEDLVLDQATVSKTTEVGHPPHADNVQFHSVWWSGRQIQQRDEMAAVRGGAQVHWVETRTSYRNYSATVAISHPSEYEGGKLEFFDGWGDAHPCDSWRFSPGDGVAFCGCDKNIHAVSGVRWGCRLVLLVWTRPPTVTVPEAQQRGCYFRPGTGQSIWLTTAELQQYDQDRCTTSQRSCSEN
mmetsp:Transcript_62734/g.149677  ORF Transcript_62734/g.149677 Transcript_62734/m.149677 type:complete len:665 (+) Transcript_62734:132-2126(+)